jgi:hypothetical protein
VAERKASAELRTTIQELIVKNAELKGQVTIAENAKNLAENQMNIVQARFQELHEELLATTKALQLAQENQRNTPGPVAAGARNQQPVGPPPENLEGLILDVRDDLVEISMGSDHALAVNHVLQVLRETPKPEYLGEIRLVKVDLKRSVGKVMTAKRNTPMRKGDIVASSVLHPGLSQK